uniref:Uncharacterized protein n=1 Tax=Caenorhabditis japonica TaxID=281687 RepID=A0A8R1IS29_CAEJA
MPRRQKDLEDDVLHLEFHFDNHRNTSYTYSCGADITGGKVCRGDGKIIVYSIELHQENMSLQTLFCLRLFKYHCDFVVAHKKLGGVSFFDDATLFLFDFLMTVLRNMTEISRCPDLRYLLSL